MRLFLLFCIGFSLLATFSFSQTEKEGLTHFLERKKQTLSPKEHALVYSFYEERNFQLIWITDTQPNQLAFDLRESIAQIRFDGLNPEEYELSEIDRLFQQFLDRKTPPNQKDLLELEGLLTLSFYRLIDHLKFGKVDPAELSGIWDLKKQREPAVILDFLKRVTGFWYLSNLLEEARPSLSAYAAGRKTMMELELELLHAAEEWDEIRLDKVLKLGDRHPKVPLIDQRLRKLGFGFYSWLDSIPDLYDSSMWQAVRRLQVDFGLEDDGIIGKNTLTALNASPKTKMQQLAVNLERMRWIPEGMLEGEKVLVNIPDFKMAYLDGADTLFSSDVIVGTVRNKTPIFSAELSHLIFSPYWNVPNSITRNEIVPAVRRDPSYLTRNKMEIISAGRVVNPSAVDWNSRSFPYWIRQQPGPHNSLGLVKFMFPNSHHIYLHDTPAKQLFFRQNRAFSHGCIRMKKPLEFALFLLREQPEWTEEKVRTAMTQTVETEVRLSQKKPVWITYFTYWSDDQGKALFKNDIYGLDEQLWQKLQE